MLSTPAFMIYVTLYRMAFSCKVSSVPKRELQSHHNVDKQLFFFTFM